MTRQDAPGRPQSASDIAATTDASSLATVDDAVASAFLHLAATLNAALTFDEIVGAVAEYCPVLCAPLSGTGDEPKASGSELLLLPHGSASLADDEDARHVATRALPRRRSPPFADLPLLSALALMKQVIADANGAPLAVLVLRSLPGGQAPVCAALLLDAVAGQVTPALQRVLAHQALTAELASVRANEQFLTALLRYGPDNLSVVNKQGIITYFSPAGAQMFGYAPEELLGTSAMALIHPDERARALFLLRRRVRQAEAPQFEVEYRMRRKDGTWQPIAVFTTNALDDPYVRGIIIHVRDASTRQAREQAQARRALHDPLTGLPNRVLFADRLRAALERPSNDGVAVLYIDLDDFKRVNDTLGHAAGDAVLVEVARRLQATLEEGDTVARLGGDEFVVLLAGPGSLTPVETGERLLIALRPPFEVRGSEVHVGASIGVACALESAVTPDALIDEADRALYGAKQAGKGRVSALPDRGPRTA